MKSIKYDLNDKNSILNFAKNLTGKTLRQVLSIEAIQAIEHLENVAKQKAINNSKKVNKGRFGHKIEKYYFEYEINNDSDSDFPCGLELKATPLKVQKSGRLAPKERMVCNIINYMDIVNENWPTSSFLKKNKETLLIRYIDPINNSISQLDYKFVDVRIHSLTNSDDYKQFEEDWHKIVAKIKAGQADSLSESDTVYLGAATKGSTAESSKRKQPFSSVQAKQRAFSFKIQYMKILLQRAPEIYKVWQS
jgi:DNA mismatch repair protein MutH